MQGFKSFPDQTLIEFHEGITAIVGPNGSGKSNVTDAIRWVLGEQSAKSLRGSRMEDVIFSGTETRRQLGYAEVTITFDNQDHNIPIDYDTVEVTRRYYRSGESEYLINQVECRLKDVRELFLDTGIGRDGYSIIGQGKIEQILSDNSEDRRKVFDEAAGIVKFKLRKKDTERKLERTENNLVRVQDILGELELRIKPLEKQAQKLKQYHSLSQELQNVDISLLLYDINRNSEELTKSADANATIAADLEEAKNLSSDLKNHYHQYDASLAALDAEIDKARLTQNENQADLAELVEKRATIKERIRYLQQQIEKDQNQLTELQTTVKYLGSDIENKKQELMTTEKDVEVLQADYTAENESLQSLLNQMKQLEIQSQDLQRLIENNKQQVYQIKSNQSNLEQEINFVTEQISDFSKELNALNAEKEIQQKQLQNTEAIYQEKKEQFETISKDLTSARNAVEEKRNLLTTLDEERRQNVSRIHNEKYRLETLINLENSREGFRHGVKEIMKKADQDAAFGEGVHGPLAELIKVNEKFEKAIEIALGNSVNHIVTDDRSTATRLINWLKDTKSGRETFLPIDVVNGQIAAFDDVKKIEKVQGYLGIASEKIKFDSIYQGVVQQLLGKVLLAESMQDALKISETLRQRYRIVTLDGDVVQVGGSMTGGEGKKNSAGLLRRNREIDQYKESIQELEEQLNSKEKQIDDESQKFITLGQTQSDLEAHFVEEERALYQLENEITQLKRQVETTLQNLEQKTKQEQALHDRKNQAQEVLLTKTGSLSDLEETIEQSNKELETLQIEKSKLDEVLSEQQEKVLTVTIDLKTKQQSLDNLRRIASQASQDFSQQRTKQDTLQKDIENSKTELLQLENEDTQNNEKFLSCDEALKKLHEQINATQAQRSDIEKKQHQLFAEAEEQAALVADLQIRLERAKQKTERLEQSIQSSKNYIWETYELMYVSLNKDEYPLDNIRNARDKVKSLKEEIRNLGSINPNALEEYKEVSERFEFMNLQKQDIEKARDSLFDVIDELETAMSEQFLTNFNQINQNFKEVFSALFIGGEAELILETEDPLTSSIQIKAQPPGKRLQNLNLLSGGERSLTAIALLLAIFRLRPAPFCVLDEVESALDESNIIRFTDYLNSYTKYSQFMLVTHRKGTMEAADRLYGITMKERGVSKVLSLELSDADNIDSSGNIIT